MSNCPSPDSDLYMCIDGLVYGPCTSEYCCGVCEIEGDCTCTGCDNPDCCKKEDDES